MGVSPKIQDVAEKTAYLLILGSSIVSVDISQSVIHQMQQRAQDLKLNLEYHCMDARDMTSLESASFDYVLDKGTVDALVCGDDYDKDITSMVAHVFRLLKPGGLYMCVAKEFEIVTHRFKILIDWVSWSRVVSFGAPQHRSPFFRDIVAQCDYSDETWRNPSKPNDPQVYYVYLLRKKSQTDGES
jgi:ubiquinone/menaquinone biosynthesis C-methylase UbiE